EVPSAEASPIRDALTIEAQQTGDAPPSFEASPATSFVSAEASPPRALTSADASPTKESQSFEASPVRSVEGSPAKEASESESVSAGSASESPKKSQYPAADVDDLAALKAGRGRGSGASSRAGVAAAAAERESLELARNVKTLRYELETLRTTGGLSESDPEYERLAAELAQLEARSAAQQSPAAPDEEPVRPHLAVSSRGANELDAAFHRLEAMPPPPQPSQSSAAPAPPRAQRFCTPDDALSISHETVSILTVNPDRQAVLINDQPPDDDSATLSMLKPGDSIQLDGERQPSARPNEIRFLRRDRSGSDEARGAASSWSRLRRSWCRVDAETPIVRDGEATPVVANELHLIGPMQEAKVGSSLCYSPADQVICVYSLAEQQRQQVVWVDPYETVLVNELPVTVQPGEPVRLQPADRVSFVNSAEQSARPTGQQPRLLVPLDFHRCRRAMAVPLDRETVVTVNFRSRLLRAGDAMYLGEGETYSLQGATQSLADGEVVVFWNTQDRPVRSDSSATAERSSEMAASSTTIDAVPAEEARALTEEQIDERVTSMHGKLRAKEAELKRTLTRQEEFNERLRTVAMRMDSTKQSLDSLDPRNAASLDECTTEHENLMIEVEVISQEIDSLVRLGLELCESSSKDDEEAMQKSLTALQKKEKSLKDLAEQKKKKILQTARDRERHQNARTRLLDDTGRLEAWTSQAETRLAQSVSSAADPDAAIEACRSINSELNSRLQELSDAQVHYNQLCEFESPDERRPIENRLHALQEAMEALKNDCIERQVALREAAKAAERAPPAAPAGADAAADAESVDSTEYRVRRQQQHAEAAEIGRQRRAAEEGLAMRLQSGIQDHHSLIQSLGNDFERLELSDEPVYDDSDELQAQLDEQLSNISRHIRRRRDETVQAVDSGTRPASLQAVDPSESPTKASLELNNALSQLSAAMTRLSRQSATESQQIQSQGRQEQQRRYQAALLAVSSALDGVESRLFRSQTDSTENPTRRAVKNLRPIPASVRRHAGCCGQPGGRERAADLAMESVADLDGRLSLLEQCAQRRQARLNECQREWRGFKDEIARVRAQLEASRRQYEASRDSSAPVEQQMRDSQLLEATIRQYEAKLAELTRKGGRILERAPQFSEADRSGELQSLRIDWEELRVRVTERRQELHRIQTSQAQYEQMLHSWAEYLETAESKLAEASLTAADSADVRRQQQQHRAFFEGLETHEATLEQARRRLDPREAARHSVQHARLGQVARAVKLAAAQRTNQMETLAQDWAELDDRLAQLDAWVAGAADRLAEIRSQPPAADEAAEERRLSGLQELASSLRGRRSAVFQLVDRGRLLLGWVACPRLETALSDLAERWVQLTDSVEDQLSVAEDRRRVGEEFAQHLADVSDCLQRAEVELESATAASGAAAAEEASLEGVRAGLERLCTVAQLLESRQRERRLLQDLAAGSPSALASTTSRRRRAEEVEAAWVGLERRWRALETRLQRRERELTPSHEALLGLRDWLSGFESRLASASRRTLHSRAETEALAAEFQ
uniref:FHA domain-containing protein n=1 Tax=Macrostomum lignano TaxID=282301 RepID=A0A1I8IEN6_9PLAT